MDPTHTVRRPVARRPTPNATYRTSEWFREALDTLNHSLPLRPDAPQPQTGPEARAGAPPLIAIVSRSQELCAALTDCLREGFQLHQAESSAEARQKARRPDLIITDFATQSDDGFELLTAGGEQALWAGVPLLLLLQEWLTLANLQRAFELAPQTDAVLFLPLDEHRLRHTIHRLIPPSPTKPAAL